MDIDEEMNFQLLMFCRCCGSNGTGKVTDLPMEESPRALSFIPKYQGWGHQWGEVEFWVYDSGNFEQRVTGLGAGQKYFYRSYVSNSGGTQLGTHYSIIGKLRISFVMRMES